MESLLEERVPQSLIDAFINGKIPIDTNVQTRIDVIAAAVAEARRKRDDWSSLLKIIGGGLNKVSASFPEKDEAGEKISDKEIKDVQNEVEGVPEKLISEIHDAVQDRSPVPPTYTLEAATLLKHYGSLIGRTTLTPVELRDGLVWAYVKALGWCSDVFIGIPNCGKEGEILGADVAIIRRYRPATHGARSAIASYGEKYIWCAVNEIAGYLADRLPRCKAHRSEWYRVSDYSELGNGMPDPFDGQKESGHDDSESSPIFFADKFWLPYVPTGDNLLAKCSDWCLHAPWPDPVNFAILNDSTILFSRLCYNEPENCARQIVTASAFAFERELAEIVKVGVGTIRSWEQGKRNITKQSEILMDMFEKSNNVSVIEPTPTTKTSETEMLLAIINEQRSDISRLIKDNSKLIDLLANQNKKVSGARMDAGVADVG